MNFCDCSYTTTESININLCMHGNHDVELLLRNGNLQIYVTHTLQK